MNYRFLKVDDSGRVPPPSFLPCLEGGIHFWTLLCATGHERRHPVKYRGWLGNTEPFPSGGSWAAQLPRGLGSRGVSVPLWGSKERWQRERLQQGKDLSWTQMWPWPHCSFPRALFPSLPLPRQALEDKDFLAAWVHLRWPASASPASLCGPGGADWWPGRACCESWPGCSPVPLIVFGKNGGRSVPGFCHNTDLAHWRAMYLGP